MEMKSLLDICWAHIWKRKDLFKIELGNFFKVTDGLELLAWEKILARSSYWKKLEQGYKFSYLETGVALLEQLVKRGVKRDKKKHPQGTKIISIYWED